MMAAKPNRAIFPDKLSVLKIFEIPLYCDISERLGSPAAQPCDVRRALLPW